MITAVAATFSRPLAPFQRGAWWACTCRATRSRRGGPVSRGSHGQPEAAPLLRALAGSTWRGPPPQAVDLPRKAARRRSRRACRSGRSCHAAAEPEGHHAQPQAASEAASDPTESDGLRGRTGSHGPTVGPHAARGGFDKKNRGRQVESRTHGSIKFKFKLGPERCREYIRVDVARRLLAARWRRECDGPLHGNGHSRGHADCCRPGSCTRSAEKDAAMQEPRAIACRECIEIGKTH